MSIIQGNSKTSAGGYSIDQSARFNDGDSPELSRTYTLSAPWTFSAWVKRCELGAVNILLGTSGSSPEIQFNSGDTLTAEALTTTAVFRDPAAWYHVHVSDNGLYINGISLGAVTTTGLTNAKLFDDFDGYVAEVHLQSGTSAYTNFGETNSDTGQWVPKAATAGDTYLKFANSSDFGENSGTSGAWTASGLTSADQRTDTPTNNHCTFNPLWIDTYTLSDGNLVTSTGADASALGTMAVDATDSDGWCWEMKVTTAATYPGVGIILASQTSLVANTALSGTNTNRYYYEGWSGNFNNQGSAGAYGNTWSGTANKVIGVYLKGGALWFSIDGVVQNSGDPSTASTGAAITGLTGDFYPVVVYAAGSGTQAAWTAQFAEADWGTTPPAGYKAINTANLSDTSIKTSGSFTGNGSTDGPLVYLNGVPTAMTINGNSVTFATHADKLANGFKVRSSSSSYNAVGSNTYSITTTARAFKDANAQVNP